MVAAADWIESEKNGDRLRLVIAGRWTLGHATAIKARLSAVGAERAQETVIDLARIDGLDSAGALLIHDLRRSLDEAGAKVSITGVPESYRDLFERVGQARHQLPTMPRAHPLIASIERLGRHIIESGREGASLLSFFGLTIISAGRVLSRPTRLRLTATFSHMEQAGFQALPIVGLLSFLVGVVLAYQSADQLARFGAEIFTVNLLGISILREIGILMTSIVVAGRSGSAFTAQIGTMKVREEVDAMRTLGLDPMEVLVLPRIFALIIVLPLLAFYADIMGLLGGALMSLLILDISIDQFINQFKVGVPISHFWIGLVKAPVFAFLIALVGCYQGLKVEGSAESVGRLTTQSVVQSIFLVIVADAFFSILFSALGFK